MEKREKYSRIDQSISLPDEGFTRVSLHPWNRIDSRVPEISALSPNILEISALRKRGHEGINKEKEIIRVLIIVSIFLSFLRFHETEICRYKKEREKQFQFSRKKKKKRIALTRRSDTWMQVIIRTRQRNKITLNRPTSFPRLKIRLS